MQQRCRHGAGARVAVPAQCLREASARPPARTGTGWDRRLHVQATCLPDHATATSIRRNAISLERFCREPVVTIQPTQSVRDAARLMRDRHVGAVLVVDGDRPIGIVTDRDIVMRAIIEGRDPNTTPVRDVMSGSLTVVGSDQKIDDAVVAIRTAGIRRLPIVNAAGKAIGIVTLDDLVVLMAGELNLVAGAVQQNVGP